MSCSRRVYCLFVRMFIFCRLPSCSFYVFMISTTFKTRTRVSASCSQLQTAYLLMRSGDCWTRVCKNKNKKYSKLRRSWWFSKKWIYISLPNFSSNEHCFMQNYSCFIQQMFWDWTPQNSTYASNWFASAFSVET